MDTKAIVTFSGGIDSTVALFWALKRKKLEVIPITFDYFRRSKMELRSCEMLSKKLSLQPIKIELPFLKEISDLRNTNRNQTLTHAPSAYIPARNVIIYSIASSYAEILDCRYIIGGHNKEDVRSYPDSAPRFFSMLNQMNAIGLYSKSHTSKVILPLSKLDKSEVIKLGLQLNVPFELTWSCYQQKSRPCRKCDACKLRAKGFEKAGVKDPLLLGVTQLAEKLSA
jgi:7-cyano-7-deazaguanine synthase